jgi:hypothetical protein
MTDEGEDGIGAASAIQHPIDREHGQRFEEWPDLERTSAFATEPSTTVYFAASLAAGNITSLIGKAWPMPVFSAPVRFNAGQCPRTQIVKEWGPLRYGPAL